jgi:hypothetical protein
MSFEDKVALEFKIIELSNEYDYRPTKAEWMAARCKELRGLTHQRLGHRIQKARRIVWEFEGTEYDPRRCHEN